MPLSVHRSIVYALIGGCGLIVLSACILSLTNRPIPEDLKSMGAPMITALLGLVAVPQPQQSEPTNNTEKQGETPS